MSNIYDVSFEIAEKKINTMLYPGNIINLIITDFEGGSDTKFIDFSKIVGKLDESDPHKKGTRKHSRDWRVPYNKVRDLHT